jgi:hypothetical protein
MASSACQGQRAGGNPSGWPIAEGNLLAAKQEVEKLGLLLPKKRSRWGIAKHNTCRA